MVIDISVQYNGGPEGLGVFRYVLLMISYCYFYGTALYCTIYY